MKVIIYLINLNGFFQGCIDSGKLTFAIAHTTYYHNVLCSWSLWEMDTLFCL